jgi:AcrR family transcriptional regulator
MPEPGQLTRQLTAADWLQAGYDILAAQGAKAVKIDTLCAHLGVTKGSFYWHFKDVAAYRAALVAGWGAWVDEDHRAMDAAAALPPRDRLTQLMSHLVSPRQWMLERAMREWARTDPEAAASVRASDRRVLEAVRQAFLAHGFDDHTATTRAQWTFALGIGALHLSPAQGAARVSAAERDELVDFLLRP